MTAARKHATYDDILALPEGVTGEIIFGALETQPQPRPRHVSAASELGALLSGPFRRGSTRPARASIHTSARIRTDKQDPRSQTLHTRLGNQLREILPIRGNRRSNPAFDTGRQSRDVWLANDATSHQRQGNLIGRQFNQDFFAGYSPERINPGDKLHRLTTIQKVTSGSTPGVADIVDALYGEIITAGTHKAPSIRVAEAAKVIENTQRDLNIALMNELSVIFHKIGIDTLEVLKAAGTKWNFLPFRPGLVGGHCIGVDPYYLTHKADMLGYHPQVILAGRRINDSMGAYVAEQTVKQMIQAGHNIKGAEVIVLGLTFKENCPDLRNSKVIDVIHELQSYGCNVRVHDPVAESAEAEHEYGVSLSAWNDLPRAAAIVAAVAHKEYADLGVGKLCEKLVPNGVFTDVKSFYDQAALEAAGAKVWRL